MGTHPEPRLAVIIIMKHNHEFPWIYRE